MKSKIHIGTSGYQYKHWKEVFYPEDLSQDEWFDNYAEHFDTVEINNTFYNLPDKETFKDWKKAAPDGFMYVLKYSRYGSHMKKLKDPEDHLEQFIDQAKILKNLMGPILVQLPPNWNKDPERLDKFLKEAPHVYRWAVEFRDRDWLCDSVYDVLKNHNAALVIHDMIDDHPREITADWTYLRFHAKDYSGNYSESQLEDIADRIKHHRDNDLEVYVYFNNDEEGHAPQNALKLKEILDM